jgi:hypothetical protein
MLVFDGGNIFRRLFRLVSDMFVSGWLRSEEFLFSERPTFFSKNIAPNFFYFQLHNGWGRVMFQVIIVR